MSIRGIRCGTLFNANSFGTLYHDLHTIRRTMTDPRRRSEASKLPLRTGRDGGGYSSTLLALLLALVSHRVKAPTSTNGQQARHAQPRKIVALDA